MFLKIFLAAITVCSLLGCLGANRRDNKRIAAVVAIVALILFTVATLAESSIKAKEAQAAAVKKKRRLPGRATHGERLPLRTTPEKPGNITGKRRKRSRRA